jgi:hypothetical protein
MSSSMPAGDDEDKENLGRSWWKSSYSQMNGQCVEVARFAHGRVGVRDSKVANGPVLHFAPEAWTAFLGELRTPE